MSVRVLVSYHYHRDTDLDGLVARLGGDVDLFADSGAYSAYASGAVIDLDAYSAWLNRWGHLFTVASNLDVIGDPLASARNHRQLNADGHEVFPVFHLGEPFRLLEGMCESYKFVALGGLVPYLASGSGNSNRAQIMRWMVRAHLIAKKTGTVLHAFGCTGSLFLRDLPFYSADSSSYMFARKRCLIYLWDPRDRVIRSFHFREQKLVRRHAHLLRRYGMEPGRVLHPDFMVNGTNHFDEDRVEVTAVCLRSYVAMEESLRARHSVPPPFDETSPIVARASAVTGTKIYFVNINDAYVDMEPLIRVAREGLLT